MGKCFGQSVSSRPAWLTSDLLVMNTKTNEINFGCDQEQTMQLILSIRWQTHTIKDDGTPFVTPSDMYMTIEAVDVSDGTATEERAV